MIVSSLRKDHIVATRSLVVEGGAEHGDELLEAIQARLERAELQETRWAVRDRAIGSGWFAPGEPWLVIEHRRIRDIRHYVRCRPVGVHLEVLHLTAIEPPLWKCAAAVVLKGGAWWSWSIPDGTSAEADLRSWLTVVSHVVHEDATHSALRKCGLAFVLWRSCMKSSSPSSNLRLGYRR